MKILLVEIRCQYRACPAKNERYACIRVKKGTPPQMASPPLTTKGVKQIDQNIKGTELVIHSKLSFLGAFRPKQAAIKASRTNSIPTKCTGAQFFQ